MKRTILSLFCGMLFLANPLKADIIYTVEQLGGSEPIGLNTTAEFGIFLSSTTSGAANDATEQPLGVDVRVTLDAGGGVSGLFTGGTNLQGGAGFGDGSQFPGDSAFYVAFWGFPPLTFPDPDTRHQIATLVLDTTGATPGDYTMSMSDLAALSAAFTEIISVNGGPASFSIVPEPTSLLVFGGLGIGLMVRRNRRI